MPALLGFKRAQRLLSSFEEGKGPVQTITGPPGGAISDCHTHRRCGGWPRHPPRSAGALRAGVVWRASPTGYRATIRGAGQRGGSVARIRLMASVSSSGTEILKHGLPEWPLAVRPGGRSPGGVRPAGLGAAARAARRRRAAAGAVRAGRRGPLTLPLASGRGRDPAAGTQVSPLDDAHNELLKFGRQSRNLDPDNSLGQSAQQTINERRARSLDVLNLVGRRHVDDARCRPLMRRERDSVGGQLHYVCRHGHGRRGPACAMARPAGLRA